MSTENNPEFAAEIDSLIQSGKKIAAVKLYRETVACSLADALRAVDAIQRGESLPDSTEQDALDDAKMDEILGAIEKGQKLGAVKIYRDSTGKSLRESKEFIESLTERLGANDLVEVRSGCASVVLIGIGLAGLATATTRWILG